MLPISVCIIGKNEEKYLDDCLQHLSAFDWEIVFVDTGSTDKTREIALKYTDNVYDFDHQGNLLAPEECTWIAINEQPVAYYHESTVDDGVNYSITGRVPVLYNDERAELILEFTDENPYGSVVGVRRVYAEGETTTVAKTMDTVKDGDVIDFLCDYYSYDGEYIDSYMLGEQLVVDSELTISDVYVDEARASFTYRFTDIYNQTYWTEPLMW